MNPMLVVLLGLPFMPPAPPATAPPPQRQILSTPRGPIEVSYLTGDKHQVILLDITAAPEVQAAFGSSGAMRTWAEGRLQPQMTPKNSLARLGPSRTTFPPHNRLNQGRWGSGRVRCSTCNGKGRVWQPAVIKGEIRGERYETPTKAYLTCPHCGGRGYFRCPVCGGDGRVSEGRNYPNYAERCPRCGT